MKITDLFESLPSTEIIYHQGDIKVIKSGRTDINYKMYHKGNYIGWLRLTDIGTQYLKVTRAEIIPEYQNKGYGKLLYKLAIQNLPEDFGGIKSYLMNRTNKVQIPKIYKSLDGYEEDGIAYIDKINENGRIIKGVNTPPGITIDHTKVMAKKLGFEVNRDGYPPIMPTNGKINKTVPKLRNLSALDKKSMFGHKPQMTKWTNGSGKDE